MSSSGDEPLLWAVRRGDSQAFAELYERHRGAVFAVARMHAGSREEAEDITSEAFTRVFALLKSGRGPRQFLRSYLVTAVSRLAADRAHEVNRTRPVEPTESGKLDRVQFFEDTVVRQVDAAVVARAFASLPERWQEVLWYLEIEGYRPRQVASVTGLRPNTVSALGKRARDGLRTAYMQEHVSAPALEQCGEYSSQLGAFVRGTLTASRAELVRRHLDSCPRCTAEYLQLQDLGLGLRAWVLPVLAGLPLWTDASRNLLKALGAAAGAGAGGTSAFTAGGAATPGGTAASIGSGMGGTATSGGVAVSGGAATSAGTAAAAASGGAGLGGAAVAASSGLVSAPVAGLLTGAGAKIAAATVGVAVLGSGSFAAITAAADTPDPRPSGTVHVFSGPGDSHGSSGDPAAAGAAEPPSDDAAGRGGSPAEDRKGAEDGDRRNADSTTGQGTGPTTSPSGGSRVGAAGAEPAPSPENPANGLPGVPGPDAAGPGVPGGALPGTGVDPLPPGTGPGGGPGDVLPPGGEVEERPVDPPSDPAPEPSGPAPGPTDPAPTPEPGEPAPEPTAPVPTTTAPGDSEITGSEPGGTDPEVPVDPDPTSPTS